MGLDFGEFGICFAILGLFVWGFCGLFKKTAVNIKKDMRKSKMGGKALFP